ncbi:aldose epimerase family protein [Flagellimonas sp.]|uniref:aldose epimerase family protein n=1 Tax=Flagellimonas sp. TaxID=2058762 RepID=UPI003B52AC0A
MKLVKHNIYLNELVLIFLLGVFSFSSAQTNIKKQHWGNVGGKPVYLYSLTNANGMCLELTNFGGIITSIFVPDKDGNMADVVLGYDNLQQYIDPNPSMGAIIGRFANRIRNGKFTIDGQTYQVTVDKKGHALHGGLEFEKALWDGKIVKNKMGNGIKLQYCSKNGKHGFPGNVSATVTYTLTDENAIHVKFEAETDKTTHVNMTQHSYFNLSGVKELIYNHILSIDANEYTELDSDAVPTGEIQPLRGKAWDLKEMTRIGDKIHDIPLNGYHHCYVLNKPLDSLRKVVKVIEPKSGRMLEVYTTQPGIVLYASNVLSDSIVGKYGIKYQPHAAFCIETQHYPDTPNYSNFPSTLLHPGEKYEETAIYDFGISHLE